MLRFPSDRIGKYIRKAAFCALAAATISTTAFAQEPPLDVELTGGLPGTTGGGCDLGVFGGQGGSINPARRTYGPNTTATGADNNNPNNYNAPLYATPNAGTNAPLYSTPSEGQNAPLYSTNDPGANAPLYSNQSIINDRSLVGGYANAVNSPAPIQCKSGIPAGEWLIFPSVRMYSIYSNNFFLAPSDRLSTFDFGVTPSVTAEWSNGIHSTTISANVDTQRFPTFNELDTFDRQATITQKYSPLPDWTFSVLGDYTHKTITNALTNSIPSAITTAITQPTLLPNGNTELPNGTIVSPTGQIVGNVNTGTTANGQTLVNPYDQYTGTATVSKIFNRAILTLNASAQQTAYQFTQNPGSPAGYTTFFSKTFSDREPLGSTRRSMRIATLRFRCARQQLISTRIQTFIEWREVSGPVRLACSKPQSIQDIKAPARTEARLQAASSMAAAFLIILPRPGRLRPSSMRRSTGRPQMRRHQVRRWR